MGITPLAEKLRPKAFEDYVGQEHLVGKNAVLRKSVEAGHIPSMILWGPPGVGKTTLANIVAKHLNYEFFTLSAVSSGVKDVRKVIDTANILAGNAVLFIDEIHRFSKSQQDSLLSAVEKGIITLIGATTENPGFEVISPLLSRCQVYILKPLEEKHLLLLVKKAKKELEESFNIKIIFKETEALFRISGGDGRKLYNAVELFVSQRISEGENKIVIDNRALTKVIQENIVMYDKNGEMHYDIISAFIKSMRGSDPNAAVYWLARLIEGGEDPKFIARRMLILASEDIGIANPNALLLANTCFDAVSKTGWPESRIILSQTAIYLATSPKSNSAYKAINKAQDIVKKTGDLPVPLHLRNAPTQFMENLNYGKGYKYAHDYKGNFTDLEFLPEIIKNTKIFEPGSNSRENEIRKNLSVMWKKYGY
jgi:putative ATPase